MTHRLYYACDQGEFIADKSAWTFVNLSHTSLWSNQMSATYIASHAMPCRISFHYCALLFKHCFFTPKVQIHLAANQVTVLWRLDPWLIDYGGVSWLPFNMWTIKSLASLSKCKYESLCPDYAARCTSIKKFWQLSWMILMWARLLSKLFHRPRVRSSFINVLYYSSLLSGYRFSM